MPAQRPRRPDTIERGIAGLRRWILREWRGSDEPPPPIGTVRLLNPAWLCLAAALLLSLLGVYAIDIADRPRLAPDAAPLGPTALRQTAFLALALLGAAVVMIPHYRQIGRLSPWLSAASLALLIFLLIPAVPPSIVERINGARAWIRLGPANLQPSELAKIAAVIAVAVHLRRADARRPLATLAAAIAIAAAPVALILLQPDLGTAGLFIPVTLAMLIAAGVRLSHLAVLAAVALVLVPLSYPFLADYQQDRILGLFQQITGDRSLDQGINYQSQTAQRLAGAGGLLGLPEPASRALLAWNSLPERHNDMIPAVVMNRFGLAGLAAIIALNGLWVAGAALTAAITRDPLGRLTAVGLMTFIAVQATVNLGMNLGLLPIIGVTLPFVSYGGSSLVSAWLMTGLIMNIGLHREPRGHAGADIRQTVVGIT